MTTTSSTTQPNPAPVQSPAPLQEFWQFVGDFRNVYANIAKIAVAAPLIDLVMNLGPPWPSRLGVSFATVCMQVLVLMGSFAIWRQGTGKLYHIRLWLIAASATFVFIFLFLYIPLFSRFVEKNPGMWDRVVVGYELQDPIKEFVAVEGKNGRVWPPRKLLEEFYAKGEDETSIWTSGSVSVARSTLLATWLLASIAYAIAVSAFVSLQYRRMK